MIWWSSPAPTRSNLRLGLQQPGSILGVENDRNKNVERLYTKLTFHLSGFSKPLIIRPISFWPKNCISSK